MIKKVFENTAKVLTVFAGVVTMVEDPGKDGQAKKKEAKVKVQEQLKHLQEEGKLPGWVVSVFGNDLVLGFMINRIVSYANREGWFETSQKILSGQ